MKYRKFKADGIFNGYQLLTGQTLVTNEDGKIADLISSDDNEDGIEKLDGILCPGFINAHCHLELSHMKGRIPEKTGLVDFVYKVITERHDEKEVMLQAIDSAEKEMMSHGIVAVGDICNNPVTLLQKLKGNLYYHNFIEVSGFLPSVVLERFKRSTDLYNAFAEFYPMPAESNSLAPHAPYSVASELIQRITAFPGNHILTMHNQEADDENQLFENKTGDFLRLYQKMNIDAGFFTPPGTSSLQASLPYFYPGQRLILVHNVCTSQEDLDYIAAHEGPALYFCLCPKANQYITGMMPPVDLFIKSNQTMVLGTDSLASNDTLSILAEINTLKQHFPQLDHHQMLRWATSNGAVALGIEERFGSFEKGKTPGIILLNRDLTTVRRIL
jgi:cytosine/adenosine deaminase-related metal-dependent hydrolase